mmetsp:Transcript_1325/g.3575  ORF Transcript_1325/g.3575 Transcript_1325/m.3575 type:complete len:265 (+) Transcript_1325:256-1050(+)
MTSCKAFCTRGDFLILAERVVSFVSTAMPSAVSQIWNWVKEYVSSPYAFGHFDSCRMAVKTSRSSCISVKSYWFFSRMLWKLRLIVLRDASRSVIRVSMSATPPSDSDFMRSRSARSAPRCSRHRSAFSTRSALLARTRCSLRRRVVFCSARSRIACGQLRSNPASASRSLADRSSSASCFVVQSLLLAMEERVGAPNSGTRPVAAEAPVLAALTEVIRGVPRDPLLAACGECSDERAERGDCDGVDCTVGRAPESWLCAGIWM